MNYFVLIIIYVLPYLYWFAFLILDCLYNDYLLAYYILVQLCYLIGRICFNIFIKLTSCQIHSYILMAINLTFMNHCLGWVYEMSFWIILWLWQMINWSCLFRYKMLLLFSHLSRLSFWPGLYPWSMIQWLYCFLSIDMSSITLCKLGVWGLWESNVDLWICSDWESTFGLSNRCVPGTFFLNLLFLSSSDGNIYD